MALTGDKPFSEIVINGMVFGEDGHKMSKSRGNVIAPEEVLEDYGADASGYGLQAVCRDQMFPSHGRT